MPDTATIKAQQEALSGSALLQAHAELPSASIQIWSFDLFSCQRRVLREEDSYRIDLCLNRRLPDASLCFVDRWAPHRFETLGKLFLLPPKETLHVRSGAGHQDVLVCRLPVARVRDWLDADPDWTERRLEASVDIPGQSIGNLLLRLGEEARRPGFASKVMVEALAIQVAVELERYYGEVSRQSPSSGLSARRLRAIEERVRDGLDPPTLPELADLCGLSVRQLSRSFKAARHVSIGAYVAQRRVEGAKELLARGEAVKVVAAKMGFSGSSSFGQAFRRATGQSPSQVRVRSRGGRRP